MKDALIVDTTVPTFDITESITTKLLHINSILMMLMNEFGGNPNLPSILPKETICNVLHGAEVNLSEALEMHELVQDRIMKAKLA